MAERANELPHKLEDRFGRRIDYLRISVTDRCNLRCFYCMPKEGIPYISSERILRYEEILQLADIFIEIGIKKIRITGGEPLIRRNIMWLLQELGKRSALEELVLTTNGTRLSEYASGLVRAGVRRVNVSLDSLNAGTYERITGSNLHERVVQGIKDSLSLGLRVKLNIVAMRGINDAEYADFVRYGINNNIDICFIEIMPHMHNNGIAKDLFIPRAETVKEIERQFSLYHIRTGQDKITADVYGVKNSRITVGFISALSHPFCFRCNKVRLMPDGTLKTCLYSDSGINLKGLLAKGLSKEALKKEIEITVQSKPPKHNLHAEWGNLMMNRVGG